MTALVKLALFGVVAVAVANSQRVVDLPQVSMPDLPWIPSWVECDFDFETYKNGPKCNDCNSIIHCTPKGGVLRNCFGWTPYCLDGRCVKEPSAECSELETVTDMYLESD